MDYDNEEIKEIIIQGINKRFEIGKREYGQGLKVDDGHEWITETLEEILDSTRLFNVNLCLPLFSDDVIDEGDIVILPGKI